MRTVGLAPFTPTGLALAAAVTAVPVGAQTRASLDAGVSHVEYDRFLPSAAFSLSPALRMTSERRRLAARATWLRFESGNTSMQGLLAGSLRIPATPATVVELGAELGASWYEEFARFSHVLSGARLQFLDQKGSGGWIALAGGFADFDSEQHGAATLSAAVRSVQRDLTLTLTGTGTAIGAVGYADLEAAIRYARPGGLEAEAALTTRAGDPGNDPGAYIEMSFTLPVTSFAGVVLAGGRYAEDAVRGNIPGRYVTAALRVAAPVRRRTSTRVALPNDRSDSEATVAAALVEIHRGRGDACTLVFRVPGATVVELMADFTDWLAVPLQRVEPDVWRVTLSVAPGRHRLNLRVGGGPWGVPAGTTSAADDFQGTVGTIVVP